MKKILALFALLCISYSSAQMQKNYYPNTKNINETGNLKDGLKDGIWEQYYENGKLKTSGNYIGGERTGIWKIYFDSGVLAGEGEYVSTKFPKEGTWKFYDSNGILNASSCKTPSKEQLMGGCNDMYQRFESKNPQSNMGYKYQENIWEISCAGIGNELIDIAVVKVQLMWNKSRSNFRCYNYSTSAFTDSNITKFSLDSGYSGLIIEFVRKYQLDLNFIDPYDNKTTLDFVADQDKSIRSLTPVNIDKANEYQRIYQLLKSKGAKHSWELNK